MDTSFIPMQAQLQLLNIACQNAGNGTRDRGGSDGLDGLAAPAMARSHFDAEMDVALPIFNNHECACLTV